MHKQPLQMKKSKLYFFLAILAGFFILSPLLAQPRTISGKVTTETEGTLPGVNVLIKGTTIGTITNPEGKYSINVESGNAVLVFSYMGYLSQEIAVGSLTELNIILIPKLTIVDEVVVIGYGSLQKRDLTGSVAQVKSRDFEKVASSSFEQGLSGQMSGVHVTTAEGTPGAGLIIKIRGSTSINASNSPLYVIDGFPLMGNNESMGASNFASFGGHTKQSPLSTLNPSDIESIEILKDASA
ncbi:MAG: carboxypeptidase-like regulatory domain-containing protein, partial [Candidatus Heimdallarchaeota archaeon]|nr:carboxypeptidase-like regulatory domain-containing protein [Candidatus Heimdallarchaeota archaeon]